MACAFRFLAILCVIVYLGQVALYVAARKPPHSKCGVLGRGKGESNGKDNSNIVFHSEDDRLKANCSESEVELYVHPCRDITCENRKPICPKIGTNIPMCVCKSPLVRHTKTKKCILPEACNDHREDFKSKLNCSESEVEVLAHPQCDITCENRGSSCPKIIWNEPLCVCKSPLLRHTKTKKCVLPEACPKSEESILKEECSESEVESHAHHSCQPTCESPNPVCLKMFITHNKGKLCFCKPPLLRAKSGKCVENCGNNKKPKPMVRGGLWGEHHREHDRELDD